MSRLADIVTRCVELLGPLVAPANAYDHTPYGNTEAKIKTIMLDSTGKVHFWAVTREATPSEDKSIPAVMDHHKLVFRAWAGLVDDGGASSAAFTEEIEAVRDAFRSNRSLKKLDGTDPKVFFCHPMQVRAQITGTFAGWLVHYAEITMEAEDYPIDFDNSP
jgi:hypothetical protein